MIRSGKDPEEAHSVVLPRQCDPYTHTLSVAYGAAPEIPTDNPLLDEAVAIARSFVERNLRRQVMCAAYRRLLRMSDVVLAIHFPGTRTQRDQWVRRGLVRLASKASPELLEKLNGYGRKKHDL